MICDICGNDKAQIRRVAETYGKEKNLLIIENIPMVSCPDCGQSYFAAETLHEIERIRLHHKSFAVERSVEVAKFG
jgi:YgiT-type zinc finger domain-containing protein